MFPSVYPYEKWYSSDVNKDGEVSEEDVELLDMAFGLKEVREKFFLILKSLNINLTDDPLKMISLAKKPFKEQPKKVKEAIDTYQLIEGLQKEFKDKFLERFTFDLNTLDVNKDGTLNSFDVVFAKREQKLSEDIKKDGHEKVILMITKK